MTADALLLTPVVLAGALVQSALGFGFSLVVAPLLLLRYDPAVGIPVLVFLNLIISVVLAWPLRTHLPLRRLLRLGAGAVAGLPVGFWIFLRVAEGVLEILVGAVVLVGVGGLGARMLRRSGRPEPASRGAASDLAAGAAAGALTSSIGVPGPALALYGSWARLERDAMRALILTFYFFVFGATVLLQAISGETTSTTWSVGGLLAPGLLVGVYAGHRLASRLDHARFHLLVLVLLATSAVTLLFSALGGPG